MAKKKQQLILLRNEYELLKKYVQSRIDGANAEQVIAAQLQAELEEAKVLEDEKSAPDDLVRLHTKVCVEELPSRRKFHFRLTAPADANIKLQKLSIYAPLGIALMGYRKGQQIKWKMPSGEKTFEIVDVENE
jgi:regulator of nucleoside diphosphate kinase